MKEISKWIQLSIATIGGYIGWFLGAGSPGGRSDGFLYALVAFIVIDYITGIMCAIIDKKLSSEIGAKGIFKKVLIFTLVGIANILDTKVLGSTGALRTADEMASEVLNNILVPRTIQINRVG